MGYKKPFILPKVTTTCNILNHTLIYSTSLCAPIVVYNHLCSQNMSMMRSPLKSANMTPPGGHCGSQKCCDNNLGFLENCWRFATGKDSQSATHTNQYDPPHQCSYPPSQQLFPCAPQYYDYSPINMTHNSSQPTTSARQQYSLMGHSGNHMTLTKVAMVSLKYFANHSAQDRGCYLQLHWECLWDRCDIIQSIGQHLSGLLLHLNFPTVHLGDHQQQT